MYSNKPIIYKKERRHRHDFICSWLEVTSFLVWLILFVIVLLYQKALPREATFFDRLLAVQLQNTLNSGYLTAAFYLLLILLALSIVSLLLNFKRLKRSTDHIRVSFIISLIFSVAGLLFMIIRF